MASFRPFSSLRALAAAGLVSTALAPLPAFALDGQDLLAKINAAQAASDGINVRAATVSVDGSTVVLKQPTLVVPGKSDMPEQSVQTGDITLANVTESGDGGYVIGEATIPPFHTNSGEAQVTVDGVTMSNFVVPADPKAPGLKSISYYDKATFGPVSFKGGDGKDYVNIASVESSMSPSEDGPGVSFEMEISDIKVTPPAGEAPWLDEYGVNPLIGNVIVSGDWQAGDGTVTVDEVTFEAKDLGTLSLSLGLNGLTEQLFQGIKQSSANMKSTDATQQQAGQLALIGVAQQLSLSDISLSFDDDGLTGKALAATGKQQGVSARQAGEALKAMVPLALAQYGIQDQEGRISNAVQTFLSDPQNLTIEFAPEKPMPLLQIMSAPMSLITDPSTTITANEDAD